MSVSAKSLGDSKKKFVISPTNILAGVIWVIGIGFAFWQAASYQNGAGAIGDTPEVWPEGAALVRATDRPTMVMFAHPKCPCTRASIGELSKMMTVVEGKAKVLVVFLRPPGVEKDWEKTDLWQSAKELPGVECRVDVGGRIAKQFEAETSGLVCVYDTVGQLQFRGGVTASRGHHGDNDGADAAAAVAQSIEPACRETEVFGCPLFADAEAS